jgi:hypothetical protein
LTFSGRYCELFEFKEVHGHCNVTDSWPENLRLARWVMTQRQMYRKGKLSEDRVRRLEAIGFVWCRQGQAWNEMFQRLIRYKEVHGDCDVPSGWKEDPQLGSWVVKQRYRGKKGLLTEERIGRLDEVGMRW